MLKFAKMHGLGNDFVVVEKVTRDSSSSEVEFTPDLVRRLADRNRGIGFDQLLIVESPKNPVSADFFYRIFNADGGEVNQCGNGARCFAHFIKLRGLSDKNPITVETRVGIMQLYIHELEGDVSVNLGRPDFRVENIPLLNQIQSEEYEIQISENEKVKFSSLSVGNPHAIILAPGEVDLAPLDHWGKALNARIDIFPLGVNVEVVKVLSNSHIRVRVYERGVGETQACGSGASAAMVAVKLKGYVQDEVLVELPGGKLTVTWNGDDDVILRGPSVHVFDGEIKIA